MMGKENVGSLAKSLDAIFKKINSGRRVDGLLIPFSDSIGGMKIAMGKPHNLNQIQTQITDISSKLID